MSPAVKKSGARGMPAPEAALATPEGLEVWLDDPTFGPLTHLGRLHRSGLESVRFEYSPLWLKNGAAFALDPELSLASGNFYPKDSNFGIFMDSCPDRWGQTLMKRRELVEAKQQARARREMGRRIRSTERGWRALMAHRQLLNPLNHGFYAWQLFSHKFLRRLTPFLLLVCCLANLALAGRGGFYAFAATLQLAGYAVILAAALFLPFRKLPLVRQLFFFAMSNAAMAAGLVRYVAGHRSTLWNPVRN